MRGSSVLKYLNLIRLFCLHVSNRFNQTIVFIVKLFRFSFTNVYINIIIHQLINEVQYFTTEFNEYILLI